MDNLVTPRIGYLLKVFPRISQTFVLSEILAHERAGLALDIFSLRRTDDTRFHASLADVQSPVFQIKRASTKANMVLDELRSYADDLPGLWDVVRDGDSNAEDLIQAAEISKLVLERGIVHLHAHFGTVGTTVARLVSQITGIGYSFTAHAKDIYHEQVDEQELRNKLHDAAGVVTVSEFNRQYLQQNYAMGTDQLKLVYNGLDLNQFPMTPKHNQRPLILGVGRLVEKKGFAHLIHACDLLRQRGIEFDCEIAGMGELDSDLMTLIQQLNLQDKVSLCGALSQGDVKQKIQQAAVLAAPCVHAQNLDRDGLPTILLEAMALGTACISTPVTGIPEVLQDQVTGLMVKEADPVSLADACERLLSDPSLAASLAHKARQVIEQRFDVNRNAAQLRDYFTEMIEKNLQHSHSSAA